VISFSPLLVVEWLIAYGTKERQSISLLSFSIHIVAPAGQP
jgi:hypothetical protein